MPMNMIESWGDTHVFFVRSKGYLSPNTFINLPVGYVILVYITFRVLYLSEVVLNF